jgi:biotin transport system ATP-binding protein
MIAVEDLVHRYGAVAAVDGVSFSVADGEYLLLCGPNGSGKTTLIRHFNGLLAPDEGRVRVNGTPVEADLAAARASVGMVFQHPRDQFVSATVGADVAFGPENLGLAREAIDRRVAEALDAVGLADRGDAAMRELSGGEQARVAIAGALAMEPDHLVLDEPLAGLDADTRTSVLAELADLAARGTSIILVSHDPGQALADADRVLALADGQIALDAAPGSAREQLPALGVRVS